MDFGFWLNRWESNQIGFHEPEANRALVEHLGELRLAEGARIFVPLCGKTLDIAWLRSRGFRVAGAELIEMAVEQLFEEMGETPVISRNGSVSSYSVPGVDVLAGNIFDVSGKTLGPVDAVYDRAALVALPAELRPKYAGHLIEITRGAPQLLVTYDYDQSLMEGPPFSIGDEEVLRHYGDAYDVSRISSADIDGGLKGRCAAKENVWLLRKNL